MNFFKINIKNCSLYILKIMLVIIYLTVLAYKPQLFADTILDPNFAVPTDDFVSAGYPAGISSFIYTKNSVWPSISVPSGWYSLKGGITTFNMGANRNIQFYYPQQQHIGVSQLYFRQYDGVSDQWIGWQKIVTENINGYVGIGTITPSYKLEVAGTTSSNLYRCSSDARYKKNISPYENALEKVLGLKGVSYFWKTEEYKERNFSKDKQIGFVAQEVERVIPELVYTDDKGYKTMSYDRLTTVIVEAIKEMKAQSDQKISALEKENAELKQKLAKLDGLAERLAVLEKAMEKQGRQKEHRLTER